MWEAKHHLTPSQVRGHRLHKYEYLSWPLDCQSRTNLVLQKIPNYQPLIIIMSCSAPFMTYTVRHNSRTTLRHCRKPCESYHIFYAIRKNNKPVTKKNGAEKGSFWFTARCIKFSQLLKTLNSADNSHRPLTDNDEDVNSNERGEYGNTTSNSSPKVIKSPSIFDYNVNNYK